MANPSAALRQHLLRAIDAYGSDLALPRGTALPRSPTDAPMPAAGPAGPAGDAPAADTRSPEPPPEPRDRPAVHGAERAVPAAAVPERTATRSVEAEPEPGAEAEPAAVLDALRAQALTCTRCRLHEGRTRVVFGEGNPRAEVMFVGEGPGANEDRTGRPFVGDAGALLTRILNGGMGLRRADVYIANVVKCRPPGNRTPSPDEAGACLPFLQRQVEIVRPRVLVCLGRTAAHHLLGRDEPVGRLRGQALEHLGIPVVVTWHPAYLLREESRKRETWEDIMRVNRMLGRPEKPQPVTEAD